jgi:AraC-like DNA-binding protein
MNILNFFPVLSTVFGFVLIVFVLFNKYGLGKNKRIRYALASLLFIYVVTSLDYYLSITNQISATYSGTTYIFYHFIGLLFYYFVTLYTNSEVVLKKWLFVVIVYTLLRILVFLPFDQYQNLQDFVATLETSYYGLLVLVEYMSVSSINIGLMFLAYNKLKGAPFVIELNENQIIHYKWIKIIVLAIVVLQLVVFATTMLGSFDIVNFNYYLQFETFIYLVFFFTFTFSIIHFPVFAYSGNFEDLSDTTKEKYSKSSLADSTELFELIAAIVEEEKLYLDYDLKMNKVAEKLDKSIHHISQAINQNGKMSFCDFINSFRIEDAKKKLMEPNPATIFAISLDVGFNSKAAFYCAFKKNTQMTPTDFKKFRKVK